MSSPKIIEADQITTRGERSGGMYEVDRIASTPTGWQYAPVVAVTMTKVTVEE